MGTPLILQPQIAPISVGIKGFLRTQLINKFSGMCRWDSGFHPNKILDSGRNQMVTLDNWNTACQLGINNTTPIAGQTQLLGYVEGTTQKHADNFGAQGSAPFYGWRRITYRFNAGGALGGQNLSEAGIGWGTASGANLISRVLIIDPITELPTTVTPLADEFVDVTYELRYYPPLIDVLGTVTLNGVVYDTITRASLVTSWGEDIGRTLGQKSLFTSDWQAYDGNIGTIEQAPSGISAACDHANQFNKAYSNNSYYIDMQCNTGLAGWNLGLGIRSIRIRTNAGWFQTQFNAQGTGARIPKSVSYSMILVWRLAWSEAAI